MVNMLNESHQLHLGQFNQLQVSKLVAFGAYLDGGQDGEILLPTREIPDGLKVGDSLNVFIHFDSEDRLIATLKQPLVEVGQFARLKVQSVSGIGAFLDWGLSKDLFLPFAEQNRELKAGDFVVAFVYLDKSNRISSSMRTDRHVALDAPTYAEGQEVELLVLNKTDLGFRALINGLHLGIIYANEVFHELHYADAITGYIKKVRDDGKIDLTLSNQLGHQAAEGIGPKILALLEQSGGFLAINDKTAAEEIYKLFGASKKKYKIALGGLYKSRLITVSEEGIRLTK